jgi:hypothetical protein
MKERLFMKRLVCDRLLRKLKRGFKEQESIVTVRKTDFANPKDCYHPSINDRYCKKPGMFMRHGSSSELASSDIMLNADSQINLSFNGFPNKTEATPRDMSAD